MVKIVIGEEGLGDERAFELECDECEGEGTVIEELCKKCEGTGYQEKLTEEAIPIPKGVDSGTVLKFRHKGHYSKTKGAGELWVKVQVDNDSKFKRDGCDLHSELKIDLLQAALGERIDIDVLTGKYRLAVPRGTTHGEKLKIENLGIFNPYSVGKKRGDHILDITVDVPKDLDENLLRIMQQYAKVESPSLKNYRPKEDIDE